MLELKQVKPIPLTEAGHDLISQTWGKEIRFEKGKKYLITAPSGKGKSTLIHLIYGIRHDYFGDILVGDQNIRNLSHEDWADIRQHTFSVVFQDLRLFPGLSAFENILLKASLSNFKTAAEIREMASALGIADLMDNNCGNLSYGQRQRVAIIRALCQPFDFLLLDEPFSHLDPENIQKATALISNELKSQKAGMLLVSLGEKYYFEYEQEIVL